MLCCQCNKNIGLGFVIAIKSTDKEIIPIDAFNIKTLKYEIDILRSQTFEV